MRNLSKYMPSTEAIDFQYDPKFKEALLEAFGNLKTNNFNVNEIETVVKKFTNITIKLHLDKKADYDNSYVYPPKLNKDHVFNGWWQGNSVLEEEAVIKLKQTDILEGSVNLRTGKVDGIFAELVSNITLVGNIARLVKYSVEEVTAIFAHELGHVITYYELIGRMTYTNALIQGVINNLTDKDKVRKVKILKDVSKKQNLDIGNVDKLAESKDETIATIFIGAMAKKVEYQMGVNVYDIRGCEQLADQYATNIGLGVPLATGLEKIYRMGGHDPYESNSSFMIKEVVFLILMNIATVGLLVPFLLVGLLLTNPLDMLYDKNKTRISKIKEDLTVAIKKRNMDKDTRKQLVKDIEELEKIADKLVDRTDFFEFIWTSIIPWSRKHVTFQEAQQELELLVNNDLFIKAAKLETLKS